MTDKEGEQEVKKWPYLIAAREAEAQSKSAAVPTDSRETEEGTPTPAITESNDESPSTPTKSSQPLLSGPPPFNLPPPGFGMPPPGMPPPGESCGIIEIAGREGGSL